MKIGIISCGGFNVTSVANALLKVGHEPRLLTDPGQKMDFLIMPGVGAFGVAMQRLNDSGFSHYIRQHVSDGKPIIGICLGMQILFESSEEDPAANGLALLEGCFHKLQEHSSAALRSPPNIGYSFVEFKTRRADSRTEQRFARLNGHFYFLHSYALKRSPVPVEVLGVSRFNDETMFPFFVRENLCGIQFHPERSGPAGLKLLDQAIDCLKSRYCG